MRRRCANGDNWVGALAPVGERIVIINIYGLPPLPPTSDFVFVNHVLMCVGFVILWFCDFSLCVFLCLCYQYWSLYGQLLLYAYHVKLRKAYVKLVFTRKATAKPGAARANREPIGSLQGAYRIHVCMYSHTYFARVLRLRRDYLVHVSVRPRLPRPFLFD